MRVLILGILLGFSFITVANGQDAEKPCSKPGSFRGTFFIQNQTGFDIEVRSVSSDCKEGRGLPVGSKKSIEITAFEGDVFRIYQNFTERYLKSVTFSRHRSTYPIIGFSFEEITLETKLCSRKGDPRIFYFKNASPDPVALSYVAEDCTEKPGPTIEPGKATAGRSFVNNVFRVYRKSDRKLLEQIIIRPVGRNYFIGGFAEDEDEKSFIKAVNAFRSHHGIAPISLDERLTQTCKWFADYMAQKDEKRAGHLLSEFRGKHPRDMNTPAQRLKRFGLSGSKANDSAEATSVLDIGDLRKLGSYFATEWTSSKTHFKPFYDIYRTKFAKVGFAATESPSQKGLFYGCAIFANP